MNITISIDILDISDIFRTNNEAGTDSTRTKALRQRLGATRGNSAPPLKPKKNVQI